MKEIKKDKTRQNKTIKNFDNFDNSSKKTSKIVKNAKKNDILRKNKPIASKKKQFDKENFINKNRKKQADKFSKKQKFVLVVTGSIIGFLNGFFGGGGGMICVPLLQKVLNLDAKRSHATAILVIFPLSLISAFIYVFNGFISSLPLLTIGAGVVIGGIIGSFALKFLPPKAVRVIFAVVMFVGGIKLIL